MLKLKKADPSRRIPVWLQARTKENLIWQLKMTVLVVAGMELWHRYEDRKLEKQLKQKYPSQYR